MKNQKEYYRSGGLSPLDAFKEGLLLRDEYIGFLKGNIIKYTIRCGRKTGASVSSDVDKAIFYLECLREELEISSSLDVDAFNVQLDNLRKDWEKSINEFKEDYGIE